LVQSSEDERSLGGSRDIDGSVVYNLAASGSVWRYMMQKGEVKRRLWKGVQTRASCMRAFVMDSLSIPLEWIHLSRLKVEA